MLFFKERGIKFQFIDMKEKGMSKGEFNSVAQVNGGLDNMINWDGKDKDLLALIKYIADEDKLDKVLENPQVIKTPVVRNGRQSTIGYQPDVWKTWKLYMYYVPDGTEQCGYYECKECGSRFLDLKIAPTLVCPYCGEEADMEIGPDEEMPKVVESAKLIQMVRGVEEVEKMDKLLSLAVTGGDFNWI